MPRASDVPSFKLANKVTPCPHNPLGGKGCGEAGAIAAPAAVMNAVHNALAPLGVTPQGLPSGVQIITRQYCDFTSLRFAELLENEYDGFVPPPGY